MAYPTFASDYMNRNKSKTYCHSFFIGHSLNPGQKEAGSGSRDRELNSGLSRKKTGRLAAMRYQSLEIQGCQPLRYYFRILLKKFPYFE